MTQDDERHDVIPALRWPLLVGLVFWPLAFAAGVWLVTR